MCDSRMKRQGQAANETQITTLDFRVVRADVHRLPGVANPFERVPQFTMTRIFRQTPAPQ